MKNKITTAAFAATHPFQEESRAFERHFPNGTTWDELIKKAVTGYRPAQDILCWWATFGPSDSATFVDRIKAKRMCGTPSVAIEYFARNCPADIPGADFDARLAVQEEQLYRVICAIHCPGGTPGATWEARIALMDTPRRRARLGLLCPGGTPGATWEARLAVQEDAEGCALLGRECPDGTPGADWSARLAVQRNAEERAYFGGICSGRVPGATLAERLAVQLDDKGREWVTEYWT